MWKDSLPYRGKKSGTNFVTLPKIMSPPRSNWLGEIFIGKNSRQPLKMFVTFRSTSCKKMCCVLLFITNGQCPAQLYDQFSQPYSSCSWNNSRLRLLIKILFFLLFQIELEKLNKASMEINILEKELDVRLCFLLFLNSFVSLSFKFNTQAVAPLYIPPSVPSEKFGKLTGADSEPKRAFE